MKPRRDMNRILPVLLLSLLLSAPSAPGAADVPLWSRTYNGPANQSDEATGQAVYGDYVYTVGTIKNSFDDDSVAYCHRKDGSLVWTYVFGGIPGGWDLFFRVVVDGSGNPYVLGATQTDIQTDHGKIQLYRFNPADNTVVWRRELLPEGYVSAGSERFVFLDNALVLTGYALTPGGGYDLYIASVSTGNVLNWEDTIDVSGGVDDFGKEIAAGAGSVFVAGEAGGTLFVARFRASDRQTEWSRIVATNAGDSASGISVTGNNVFVSATLTEAAGFTPTLFRFSATDNGAEIWRRQVAGVGGIKNYAGTVLSTAGTAVFAGTIDRSGTDTFLNAYADNGDLLWAKDLGVTGKDDLPSSIFFDGSRWILLGMFPPDPLTEAAAGFKTFAPDGTPLETVLFGKTGSGTDYVFGGAIDNAGNVFLAGRKSVGDDQDFFIGKAGPAPPSGSGGGGGCLAIAVPGPDSSPPWQSGILLLPGFLLLARRVVRKTGCNIRRFGL